MKMWNKYKAEEVKEIKAKHLLIKRNLIITNSEKQDKIETE